MKVVCLIGKHSWVYLDYFYTVERALTAQIFYCKLCGKVKLGNF